MNIFTQLIEIDNKIALSKEKKKQQQLFQIGVTEQRNVNLFNNNNESFQVSPLIEAPIPEKEKVAPLISGFGPWVW